VLETYLAKRWCIRSR